VPIVPQQLSPFGPHVVAAQFSERVGPEFRGDFLAPAKSDFWHHFRQAAELGKCMASLILAPKERR